MPQRVAIGIDPGMSGGIAALWPSGEIQVYAMPETERDILDLLRRLANDRPIACIERVNAFPGQGLASTWKFSGNYHGLRMALHACQIPFEAIAPGVWQKAMGCLTKGDKNVTKRRAQELYPAIKVTHAIADALLLATYCQRLTMRR